MNISRRSVFADFLFAAPLVLGLVAGAGRADRAKPDLACKLTAPARTTAGKPVEITFTLSNRGRAPVSILRWYTPLEGVRGDIFRVSRAGRRLPYEGPLMKRGDPGAADYVEIPPGGSATGTADLSAAYGIGEPGKYRVAFTRGLPDVIRQGEPFPRPRAAHRPRKLSCGEISLEVTPK
jgi:hypothetical protein